jgi:hypothetical protein
MSDQKSKFSAFVENLKSFFTLTREAIIVIVIAFLLLWPADFKRVMEDAGFTKFNFPFGTWESKLEAAKNNLEEANQVIEQNQAELEEIKSSVQVIAENPNLSDESRREIEKINERIDKSYDASMLARDKLEINIQQQGVMLEEIRQEPVRETGRWAIVAGADQEKRAAMHELNKLLESGYENVQLWVKDDWYRTLVVYNNKSAADQQLPALKRRFRESAYIINLNEWCPNPKEVEEGVFECSGR